MAGNGHSYENPVAANHDSQVIIVRVSRRLTRTVVVNHQTTTGLAGEPTDRRRNEIAVAVAVRTEASRPCAI